MVVAGGLGGGLFVTLHSASRSIGTAPAAPSAPPPTGKQLAALVPANYVVTKEAAVTLDPHTPPLVVVTDAETQGGSGGLLSADLLLLAWDGYVHRWVTVFDGSKAPGSNASEPLSDNALLPTAASVTNIKFETITPMPGRTDLAFSAQESFGANSQLAAGIVHYDGQTASVVYSQVLEDGDQAVVTGRAPHQRFVLTAPWITEVDPIAMPVRHYRQVVSWVAGSQPQFGGYATTSDSRSWLGVYAIPLPSSTSAADAGSAAPSAGAPLVVISVAAGSPAAGVLQVGDEIVSVQGVAPRSSLLGPAIVDEVAAEAPGTPVALSIVRNGQQMVKNVTLSSYAAPARGDMLAPVPGYLGVSVITDTSALAASYGLGASTGVVVAQVESGSPAESAGLNGEDVITAVDGTPVSDANSLVTDLAIAGAGTTVTLTVVAPGGAPQSVPALLGSFPNAGGPTVYGL